MKSFRANVRPELLVWARESVRLSQHDAARKLSVSVDTLMSWESGENSPTIVQLRKVSDIYKRPLAVLYLRRPPTDFDTIKSFRQMVRDVDFELEYALTVGLERVFRQQEILLDLLGEEANQVRDSLPRVDVSGDAETIGAQVSAWLGLETLDQQRWARSGELTRQLTSLIEEKGIPVTQVQRVGLEIFRGCALTDHRIPAIIVNGKDSGTAKAFTLMHELLHILLRASGSDDVIPMTGGWRDYDKTERFCNLVSAAILLPEDQVRLAVSRIRHDQNVPVSQDELRAIATTFGLSSQAIMIRLIGLGLETWETYGLQGWQYNDQQVSGSNAVGEENSNLPLYYPLKVRDLGRLFIGEVRSAYDRSDIGVAELVDYLDIKWENVPRLMKQAGLPS